MGIFSKRRQKQKSFSKGGSLLRWFGPMVTSAGILFGLYMLLSGAWSFSSLDSYFGTDPEANFRGETISLGDRTERPIDRLRVATFNMDHFSDQKSNTRVNDVGVDVLGTIAKVVSALDIVAIQELQGDDGAALERLVKLLNESGGRFAAIISDPVGEDDLQCYAFLWDRSRVNLVPSSAYVVLDQGKRMYREPMVASFQSVIPEGSPKRPFRFTMINAHTRPDRVDPNLRESEINVLADVFQRVRQYENQQFGEDDFILLGDLNVSAEQLGQLSDIEGIISLAASASTLVGETKSNDHILIDRNVTNEYAGQHGVIDFVADLGLTLQQAQTISDHFPVWAEFEIYERDPPIATRPVPSGPRTRLIQ